MRPDLFPDVFPLPDVIVHEGTLAEVSAMLDAAEAQEAALAAAVLKPGDLVFVSVGGWLIPATVVELQGTRVVVEVADAVLGLGPIASWFRRRYGGPAD